MPAYSGERRPWYSTIPAPQHPTGRRPTLTLLSAHRSPMPDEYSHIQIMPRLPTRAKPNGPTLCSGSHVTTYNPIRPEGIPVQRPALGLAGTVNPFMSAELENIHRGQQAAMQRRAPRQSHQKGKAEGQGKGEEEAPAPRVPRYKGTDTQC